MLQEKWYPLTWMFCSHVKGALNISSSKPKAQLSDNHTIQEFVKDYVDEYVGECTIISHVSLLFYYFLKFVNMFLYMFFSFVIQGELNISSSQTPDNRTIQNFVKDYVKEYVGGYNFTSHVSLLLCYYLNLWVMYQTRETVFHRDMKTPRIELKIWLAAEYFWRNSRFLDSR